MKFKPKKKGAVARLNDVFEELGLESLPETPVSALDAIIMLEDTGGSYEVREMTQGAWFSEICNKTAYPSHAAATAVMKKRKRQGSGSLRVYFCNECNGFHLSSAV